MSIPYARRLPAGRRVEVTKILRRLGCERRSASWTNFQSHEVLLAFSHRDRRVQLRASTRGWAELFLKKSRGKQAAAARGRTTNRRPFNKDQLLFEYGSLLVTAIETGVLTP